MPACKCYRSRLESLAKDHPEFRGKGGLTKRAIQRLTVGARIAIRMHSKTKNVSQLRHDLRNGPNHVFGDHAHCNPVFCKAAVNRDSDPPDSDSDSDTDSDHDSSTYDKDSHDQQPLTEQLNDIVGCELDDEPTATDVHDARNCGQTINSLPVRLLEKVKAAGDRLVMLSASLIENETSNLAECYMSIRSVFDGGKQYNRVQSGSFEGRCCAAGMRVQVGPSWQLETLEYATSSTSGNVSLHI